MAQKTYQQIEAEANRLFGNKPSTKKFDWRRAQQRAAGLETEKKKRGFIAGAYDRNKKLASAGATALGYLFGGPTGAGLARGAVQGFDRPGKSGIGFDVKRGLKGGLEGYAAGQGLNLAQSAVSKVAPKIGGLLGMGSGATAPAAGNLPLEDVANANITQSNPSTMSRMLGGAGNLASGAMKFAKENPNVIAGAVSGVTDYLGDRATAEAAQRRLDLEEEMYREEQARKQRLAQLLMPFFQQQLQQYNPQAQG